MNTDKREKKKNPPGRKMIAPPLSGWSLRLLLLVGGPLLFLAGLVYAGRWTLEQIRGQDRFAFAFADIECTPPEGQDRNGFLAEVRYLTDSPERWQLLDDQLTPRLADVFARHPWVEKVERVEVVPPRQVRVRLAYRVPVLAVKQSDQIRVVDARGILLPASARTEGLPVLRGSFAMPGGPAGTLWGDPVVEGAARTAQLLRPKQDLLHLTTVENGSKGLIWRTPAGSRVLWGQPLGTEPTGEAAARAKLQTLITYCAKHGDLDKPEGRQELDVR